MKQRNLIWMGLAILLLLISLIYLIFKNRPVITETITPYDPNVPAEPRSLVFTPLPVDGPRTSTSSSGPAESSATLQSTESVPARPKTGSLLVVVTDEKGTPLPRVPVLIINQSDPEWCHRGHAQLFTNQDGHVYYPQIYPGLWNILLTIDRDDADTGTIVGNVAVKAGEESVQYIIKSEYKDRFDLSGEITWAKGDAGQGMPFILELKKGDQIVAGGMVLYYPRTKRSGEFTFPSLPRGDYVLEIGFCPKRPISMISRNIKITDRPVKLPTMELRLEADFGSKIIK